MVTLIGRTLCILYLLPFARLIETGELRQDETFTRRGRKEVPPSATSRPPTQEQQGGRKSAFRRQMMTDGGGVASGVYRRKPIRRYLNPTSKAPGTRYDILGLINDYRNIMLCVNEHNKWIGRLMGGAQAANYAQFVSDVFMMIQVLT